MLCVSFWIVPKLLCYLCTNIKPTCHYNHFSVLSCQRIKSFYDLFEQVVHEVNAMAEVLKQLSHETAYEQQVKLVSVLRDKEKANDVLVANIFTELGKTSLHLSTGKISMRWLQHLTIFLTTSSPLPKNNTL